MLRKCYCASACVIITISTNGKDTCRGWCYGASHYSLPVGVDGLFHHGELSLARLMDHNGCQILLLIATNRPLTDSAKPVREYSRMNIALWVKDVIQRPNKLEANRSCACVALYWNLGSKMHYLQNP